MAATALPIGYRQAMSNAVRAAVVARTPSIEVISSSTTMFDHTSIPVEARRLPHSTWAGWLALTHFARCNTAADRPAATPRRPVHRKAALARVIALISASFAMYTSGWIAANLLRKVYGDSRPARTASLP